MSNYNTPYDDSFRTLLTDCKRLVIPLVNELFQETYAMTEKVELYQNELFVTVGKDQKRITDSNISIGEGKKRYHIECQSSMDGTIIVRVFEYASQIAIIMAESSPKQTMFRLPQSGILLLRCGSGVTRKHVITVQAPDGNSISYQVPVLCIKDYSLDIIFEKELWFLLPFYFFNYKLDEMDRDSEMLQRMMDTYKGIWHRLDMLVDSGVITEMEKGTIKAMCDKVAMALSENYKKTREGVDRIMGGKVLDYEAKRIAIRATVEGAVEVGGSKDDIVKMLQSKYYLSAEEAEERYKMYAETPV